jgi:hypothetical protein
MDSEPEDWPLVLDVVAEAIDTTDGRLRWLSAAEAGWVAKIRRAYPDLDMDRAYGLARMASAAESGLGFYHLEGVARYLAYRPWRDGAERYVNAFVAGRITEYYGIPPHDPSDQEVMRRRRAAKEAARKAERQAAIEAGANPFLDGRPYRPEDET